jgi:integrase
VAKVLTTLSITGKDARPGKARREIADGGCRGLYLVVFPNGNRSWVFRYRFLGKPKKLTIGPVYLGGDEIEQPTLGQPNTLAGARRLAVEAGLLLAKGTDPAAAKFAAVAAAKLAAEDAEAANGLTVTVLAKRFIRDHAMQRTRESSWRQTARLIGLKTDPDDAAKLVRTKSGGEVLSQWGDRPAHSIVRADVNELLRAIVTRGAPVTSNRVLAAIRKMFNWAVAEDILATTPCIGVTKKADESSRERVLSASELRLIWKASDAIGYPWPQFVKLLILTLQRRTEVAGIRRKEVQGRVWTIPSERAKNGEAHEVPLSDAALDILGSCKTIGKSGFYLTRYGEVGLSGFSKAKGELDAEISRIQQEEVAAGGSFEPVPNWTFHDLRRTGATGLAKLGVEIVVTEHILNHVSGSLAGVAGVYNRFQYADRKRAALDAWTAHVLKVVNG